VKKGNKSVYLGQLVLLALIVFLSWELIHRTPADIMEAHTYFEQLPYDLVDSALRESLTIDYPEAWADLIAVRSTVPQSEADPIIEQLKQGIPFSRIEWGNINKETLQKIRKRKKFLLKYPYYEPGRFTFPVIGETWYTDTFGADREGGRRSHEGTDLFSPEGTPIVSVCDGIVEKAGWNRLGGERVGIRGFDGNYYYYAHLQEISPKIYIGKKVTKGEILGKMGHTGDAITTPDHLHFGIELPTGQWINPYPFLRIWEQNFRM